MNAPKNVEMSENETLKAEIARLNAEKQALVQAAANRSSKDFTVKLSDPKKAIQVGGLSHHFGCTQYAEDYLTILENGATVVSFILANANKASFGRDGKDTPEVINLRRARAVERCKALLKKLA